MRARAGGQRPPAHRGNVVRTAQPAPSARPRRSAAARARIRHAHPAEGQAMSRDHITDEAWFGPGGPGEREPGAQGKPARPRDPARRIAEQGEPNPLDGWVADIIWDPCRP